MSFGDAVFRRIQAIARSAAASSGNGAPTQEYLIRHTLESFLDRLTRTSHAGDFVLKGGVLLAAYRVRRPTKDTDSNAVHADVTAEHLAQVVRDIAAIDADDGVVFGLDTITLLGYAPETTIAEKGVTILERGITSTRWRDYVDIVAVARQGVDAA